jgi:hypothetical protein
VGKKKRNPLHYKYLTAQMFSQEFTLNMLPAESAKKLGCIYRDFFFFVCEAIGTAATPGLLCQPWVIVKMIVEKQMECRLAGEIEVLGENLPQRHNLHVSSNNVHYLLFFSFISIKG